MSTPKLTAIAGPDGQQTTVTLDANGYVAALTDPNKPRRFAIRGGSRNGYCGR